MTFLFDPNVAFALLVLGFLLSLLALFTPGTGLLEVGALAALGLTGYALYHLSLVNWWAILIMAVGIVPMIFAVRKAKRWYWSIATGVLFTVGAIFLVPQTFDKNSVNPFFAFFLSAVAVAILWLIGRKSFEAMKVRPTQDLKKLEGQVGEARTEIKNSGTVYVGGEEWSARSATTIHAGAAVIVIGRQGLVLLVEPAPKGE